MTENNTIDGENADEKHDESRSPRSIRFSDSEWGCIEQEAAERGMTAARAPCRNGFRYGQADRKFSGISA